MWGAEDVNGGNYDFSNLSTKAAEMHKSWGVFRGHEYLNMFLVLMFQGQKGLLQRFVR